MADDTIAEDLAESTVLYDPALGVVNSYYANTPLWHANGVSFPEWLATTLNEVVIKHTECSRLGLRFWFTPAAHPENFEHGQKLDPAVVCMSQRWGDQTKKQWLSWPLSRRLHYSNIKSITDMPGLMPVVPVYMPTTEIYTGNNDLSAADGDSAATDASAPIGLVLGTMGQSYFCAPFSEFKKTLSLPFAADEHGLMRRESQDVKALAGNLMTMEATNGHEHPEVTLARCIMRTWRDALDYENPPIIELKNVVGWTEGTVRPRAKVDQNEHDMNRLRQGIEEIALRLANRPTALRALRHAVEEIL